MRIGVFDSGLGGLTVLAAIRRELPGHDLVYLGDTARIPYGTRSPRTVRRYSGRVASYLHGTGIDALVIACNTATTHALEALDAAGREAGVPVYGVVAPGVSAALRVHTDGTVAVLGTPGTIAGGAYQTALSRAGVTDVQAVACPLFVPLVEEGWLEGDVPRLVAERYLAHLRGRVDVAILGCTHYPLLRAVISQVLPGTSLVDAAQATAEVLRQAHGPGQGTGSARFLVTDQLDRFTAIGARFLGAEPAPATWVDVGDAAPPFDIG